MGTESTPRTLEQHTSRQTFIAVLWAFILVDAMFVSPVHEVLFNGKRPAGWVVIMAFIAFIMIISTAIGYFSSRSDAAIGVMFALYTAVVFREHIDWLIYPFVLAVFGLTIGACMLTKMLVPYIPPPLEPAKPDTPKDQNPPAEVAGPLASAGE